MSESTAASGRKARLIVVSGPSGAGKSTLVRRTLERPDVRGRVRLSISATTRPPRPGEREGEHYFFLTREQFQERRAAGAFLEWAEVHGQWYGTPADWVRGRLEDGQCVLLEIDVQGGRQVRSRDPEAVLIFVDAPDLEDRLRGRGTESEADIRRRLAEAQAERAAAAHYETHLLNDDLDRAAAELAAVLAGLGCGRGDPPAGTKGGTDDVG